MIELELQTGGKVAININMISNVKEYPAGQTWIEMSTGQGIQVKESVEEVMRQWSRLKKD